MDKKEYTEDSAPAPVEVLDPLYGSRVLVTEAAGEENLYADPPAPVLAEDVSADSTQLSQVPGDPVNSYCGPGPPTPVLAENLSTTHQVSQSTSAPTQFSVTDGIVAAKQVSAATSVCWLVVSIFSAILCCLPLGVAGAVLSCVAITDANRQNKEAYQTRLCQARIVTGVGIGLGLVGIVAGLLSGLLLTFSSSRNDEPLAFNPGVTISQPWDDQGVYLGCFQDIEGSAQLDGMKYNFGWSNGARKCVEFCAMQSFKYAGLQGGDMCHCGNYYNSTTRLQESSCDVYCQNTWEICGGYSKSSIYRTNFLGCFHDDFPDMSLGEFSAEVESHQECITMCGNYAYGFAGLQNSSTCYCGYDPNRYGEANLAECDIPCEYNSSLTCGGVLKNTVYKTHLLYHSTSYYLGCFLDRPDSPDLNSFTYTLQPTDDYHTCVSICAHRGLRYAGLQNGTECFCSQTYGRYGKMEETECYTTCPASDAICGGINRNTVYRTFYLGCFEDDAYDRALNENVDLAISYLDFEPAMCITTCEVKEYIGACVDGHWMLPGFLFAGVQNGNECYCGHDFNKYQQAPDNDCDILCDGSSGQVCGGHLRNSLYKTSLLDF